MRKLTKLQQKAIKEIIRASDFEVLTAKFYWEHPEELPPGFMSDVSKQISKSKTQNRKKYVKYIAEVLLGFAFWLLVRAFYLGLLIQAYLWWTVYMMWELLKNWIQHVL